MSGHDHEPAARIKRHARLRDIDLRRPLWAGSDADWKLIIDNRYSVICDREGCRGPLVPNDCDEVKRRRHMSYPKGSGGGCGHHDGNSDEEPAEADRGMSERHRWMQNYITEACRRMGYSAVPEHELAGPDGDCVARADVWVEPARIAVEVQQRSTDFKYRTAARANGGAVQTIWLLSHDANAPACRRALFSIPAARFMVLDRRLTRREQWAAEFEPWSNSPALNEFAVLWVWASTWQLTDDRPYLRTCKLDLQLFLRQVLEGRRVWVGGDPAMPRLLSGRPKAGWVLLEDLDEVRSRIARDDAAEAAAAVESATASVEQELPGPDMPGNTDHDDAITVAAAPPPPPVPQPPAAAASKPASPIHVSVPSAARTAVRAAAQSSNPRADWEWILSIVATAMTVIVVAVFAWAAYQKVNRLLDDVETWWNGLTQAPVVVHCNVTGCGRQRIQGLCHPELAMLGSCPQSAVDGVLDRGGTKLHPGLL